MTSSCLFLLFGYTLLAATGWALQGVWPSSLPGWEAGALGSLLVLLLCLFLPSEPGGAGVGGGGWGALVFAVAWGLSAEAGVGLPGLTRTAMFTLVPIGVVLGAAARGYVEDDFLSLLTSALAGVGGAFLLLPAEPAALIRSPLDSFLLILVLVGLGGGAYPVFAALRSFSPRAGALLLVGGKVLGEGVAGVVRHRGVVAPVAGDLPGVLLGAGETGLLVALLGLVRPVPLAARFLLVPLAGVVEGLVLVRPAVTWRLAAGFGLLVYGAVHVVRWRGEARDSSLSLL